MDTHATGQEELAWHWDPLPWPSAHPATPAWFHSPSWLARRAGSWAWGWAGSALGRAPGLGSRCGGGGQQVQDNRATGEAGGAGATVGGEVAIVQAALVGPMQERHPCEPLGHPGSCSEVVQMPGRRHRAKPLPWVSATRQVAMTTSTFILVPLSGHGPAFVTKP